MKLNEKLRNKAYFVVDKLKGGIVENALKDLEHFESLDVNKQFNYVNQKWGDFHLEITSNVPYFKHLRQKYSLSDFPVINKKMIAKDPKMFYNCKYELNKLVPVRTSGSYGTPVTYYLTPAKKKRQQAEVMFYGRKCGYDVGVTHGYFRSEAKKDPIKLWLQNQTMFASKEFSDAFLSKGLQILKSKDIKTLIGFPSSISYLAKYCIDTGHQPTDFKVTGVITQSENLTKYHRDIMYKAFNCLVHNRYSTEEFGVLGNEFEYDQGFEMNCCNYIFEVLKLDKDESVEVGEIGRLVVTDLHSNAMPLIRYETGDLAVLGEFLDEKNKWVRQLSRLSGRAMQIIYNTKGVALYPLYLDSIMEPQECFAQYQLIQLEEKTYTLKLVKNNLYDEHSYDMVKLQDYFYNWLGHDAIFTIEFVEDIEKLPSGKRPYIINKYKVFNI